jgi:hypothetical protein
MAAGELIDSFVSSPRAFFSNCNHPNVAGFSFPIGTTAFTIVIPLRMLIIKMLTLRILQAVHPTYQNELACMFESTPLYV